MDSEKVQTTEITEKMFQKLRSDLLVTRILTMICSLLMICILAGGFIAFKIVQDYTVRIESYMSDIMVYAENIEPALNQLAELDMETLNTTMKQMTIAFEEVDFEELAEQMEDLDVDAINDKIDALDIDAINEALAGLDTKELTTALENLNQASEKIREIGEKLSKVTSFFG